MNLIVDVGNSFVKLAIFNRNKIEDKTVVSLGQLVDEIQAIQKKHPKLKRAIVSSVARLEQHHIEALDNRFMLLKVDYKTKLPFNNCYETPETLGVDRMALVSASVFKFPNSNVLIIDAGTCITYDFITAKNDYLGGAISPGIRMRYQALNNLTANLPLLETTLPNGLIGRSTVASMHLGVVNGVLKEIDGIVEEYEQKYSDLTVILTGGDANFLSKQLKSSIFANSNFLLEGLNYILQFNSI